ncbi:MAG: DedA family protein [Candidatus Peregrinibacteria bacterium]
MIPSPHLLPHLENLGMLGYWFTLVIACLESLAIVGSFIPGTTIVVLMGIAASQGWYDFWDLVFFAIAGSVLGDALSYEFGRHGKKYLETHPRLWKYIEKGQPFFRKWGVHSVALGRFIGPLRGVTPLLAGIAHMRRIPFYGANIVSGIVWGILHPLLGFFLGGAAIALWERTKRFEELLFALVILILLWIGYRIMKHKIHAENPDLML